MSESERTVQRAETGIPAYAMLDVWMALGGDSLAFDRMWAEDRRSPADTWAQLMEVIRGGDCADDHNPPPGPEFDALLARRSGLTDCHKRPLS